MKNNILYGKGKEYSDIANEIEKCFNDWISFSKVDSKDLFSLIQQEECRIEKNINDDGNIEVNLLIGEKKTLAPFLFQVIDNDVNKLDNFIVNVLLVFTYISSNCNNKLDNEIKRFSDSIIKDKKTTLD